MRTLLLLAAVTAAHAAAPPMPVEPKPPSPRMQKLTQLSFDRRPSAVLDAWAPKAPPKVKDAKPEDPIDKELREFQRRVTLGRWDEVKAYLAGLPADEGKAGYRQLLAGLQRGPMMRGGDPQEMMMMMEGGGAQAAMMVAERNHFAPDDVVGLAAAAPGGLEPETMEQLGGVVRTCLQGGTVVEALVTRLRTEAAKPKPALSAKQAATLLANANEAAHIGPFLPPEETAKKERDIEAMNLLVRHYLGRYDQDKKLTWLEQAWGVLQSSLEVEPVAEKIADTEKALQLAVELAPRIKESLGQKWLEESFTREPTRGMTLLATIGRVSSSGLQRFVRQPDQRLKALKLMKTAVEALVKSSPARAKEWGDTLTLLAACWSREAGITQQFAEGSGAARMRRDRYGNMFWYDDPFMEQRRGMNPNQPQPISVVDCLSVSPSPVWMAHVHEDLRPKMRIALCNLHLKADEEDKAFPYVEQLATTHPRQARELANEFLRVWTRNHDPNAARAYTNPYMWMYGFEQRADGIPLTRSKQERNLTELAAWVVRLKKLPLGEIDEEVLSKAFTACHSTAEVYKAEAIEKVFGPIGGLKPRVLSGLAQTMRENLAGVWRRPEPQNDKKTRRKTKDIQQEVKRGYAVARETVEGAMKKFPEDWSLVVARAAILHDEVNFLQEVEPNASYASNRAASYAEFARAAKLYAAVAKGLPEEDQSTRVYEQWLYASLGAVDVGQVNEEKVPDGRQPALVRAAILALPGELAGKHMDRFANLMFTRLSSVRPQVKYRYLKAGFDVVGDHKDAAEAKKVFDYYNDLTGEIRLEAKIDGPAAVGHKQPFGVYVFLRHTRDIEREAGGFGRYLQNQNTGTGFSWNYGRPTADYRDRFQTAATEAMKEHFDVVSVTFETDKVHSRAAEEYGWRVTPYAYLLLKARGPQVDRLPPMRMDLDFLDTSGYAVLPIESAAVPLDATAEKGEPRPVRKLEITQTLDERQAGEGKLILEVKATGQGLVPDLSRVLALEPEGFEIAKVDDQGVSVSKFDQESDKVTVVSERLWSVTLRGRTDLAALPTKFAFGKPKAEDAVAHYHRYVDADLAKVDSVVELERAYGRRGMTWLWWVGGAAVVLAVVGVIVWRRLGARGPAAAERWAVPETLTPFSAIALLERIEREGGLSDEQRADLGRTIRDVERRYFAGKDGPVDLREVTAGWVKRAR